MPGTGTEPERAKTPPLRADAEEEDAVDVAGVEGRLKSSLRAKATLLIDRHADRALEVLRGWMRD